MNSNSTNSTKLRETFGIIDGKTGKTYPDILNYHLEVMMITDIKLLQNSVLTNSMDKQTYPIQIDSKLKRLLRDKGIAKVIVSFQIRTNGKLALARIYQNTQKEIGELK